MTEPLGFVVLAHRPGQPDEPVSAIFPAYPNGLEQAHNVLESCEKRRNEELSVHPIDDLLDVEYVIGQISEVETP